MKEHNCTCKGCQEERAALQRQWDSPFYKRVETFRGLIRAETMEKAAKKYKEPFNPHSWTVRELGKHAMAENYDQSNYIVGLMEKAEALEAELDEKNKQIEKLENQIMAAKWDV